MNDFTEELQCLEEIEEMVESTNLLQNLEIREHFKLLLELKDELVEDKGNSTVITESILEDISIVTKEITYLIETQYDDCEIKKVHKHPARYC